MPKFNFNTIARTEKADVNKIGENFTKIENNALVLSDLDNKLINVITGNTIRPYSKNTGIYKLPYGCKVYYYGSSNTNSYYTMQSDGYLIVCPQRSETSLDRYFYIFDLGHIIYGWSSSSNGTILDLNSKYILQQKSIVRISGNCDTATKTISLTPYFFNTIGSVDLDDIKVLSAYEVYDGPITNNIREKIYTSINPTLSYNTSTGVKYLNLSNLHTTGNYKYEVCITVDQQSD